MPRRVRTSGSALERGRGPRPSMATVRRASCPPFVARRAGDAAIHGGREADIVSANCCPTHPPTGPDPNVKQYLLGVALAVRHDLAPLALPKTHVESTEKTPANPPCWPFGTNPRDLRYAIFRPSHWGGTSRKPPRNPQEAMAGFLDTWV